MGRSNFFALRDERRRLQREKKGYVPGAHRKEDAIREKDKRLPTTKNIHRYYVNLWINFTANPENGFAYYKTAPGCPAPSHEMIKEFIRWHIGSITGRLDEDERPTVRTISAGAECFFGGFEELTKVKIIEADRKEIKTWIKRTLTAEGIIVDKKKQKLNFTKNDFLRIVSSLWQTDHQTFIPGLLKVVILFALQLYLFTGARVGSFIPSIEHKHERGLRYKHIDLVLFPSSTAPWAVGWRVNQVWLKNNRCPQYTVFGIGIRDSNRPQFASGYLLLALALDHGALFGIKSVDDLAQFDLSNGEIPLRWKSEFLEKPVLRHATGDGPQEIPLTKQKFCACLRQIFSAAGYFGDLATVHCMRRNLGKKVERRHGSAPVSQIMAHKGLETFPEHYQAHCSSIDTVSAVLDEEDQSDHIEYFQSYVQFYERGLPGELPAAIKESILEHPDMVEMRARMEVFEKTYDNESLKIEKLEYRKALVRNRLSELKKYQNRWVQEKRDQKILNRGKEKPAYWENDTRTRVQRLIAPEVARIASAMSCTKELSFDEKLLFVQDLQSQCGRDFDVVYLPNESPVQGICPAGGCSINVASLRKCDRSAHIHECVRRGKAFDLQVSESKLRFCYECMEWFMDDQWRQHCELHLQTWQNQHCEVILYRYTVIRPGYCPFCLWNQGLFAEDRLQYWLRSDNLREHIEGQHMNEVQWSTKRSTCGCLQTFESGRELRHHLHDAHGLNEAIWQSPKPPRKRKRSCKAETQSRSTKQETERPRKALFYRYSPPCQRLDHQLSRSSFVPIPIVNSFIEEHPEQHYCSSISEKSSSTSRSSSVVSCFSAPNSTLSSRPTTPGLEVIDPKILGPIAFSNGNDDQACEEAAVLSTTESKTPNISLNCAMRLNSPASDIAHEEPSQEECLASMPPNIENTSEIVPQNSPNKDGAKKVKCKGDGSIEEKTGDQKSRCDIQPPFPKNRSQQPPHHSDESRVQNLRRKLYAKEKRELLKFKSQNLTLRQVGRHFTDIDTAFLRQAWLDLSTPQRCTRSRTVAANYRN